jgi:hypothetical protein
MKTKDHMFGFGETIQGIIRKYNLHNMPQEVINLLSAEFNRLNGEKVPRVGQTFRIPLYYNENDEIPDDSDSGKEKAEIEHIHMKPRMCAGEKETGPDIDNMPRPLPARISTAKVAADDEGAMKERQKRRETARRKEGTRIELPEKPKKEKRKPVVIDYTNVTPIDKPKDKADNTPPKSKKEKPRQVRMKQPRVEEKKVQTTPRVRLVDTVFNPKTRNRRKRLT